MMKRADVVMNFLEKYSSVCDDCLSEQCKIFPRQQINNITRTLYSENKIWKEKGICSFCLKNKLVSKKIGKSYVRKIGYISQKRKIPFPTESEITKYLNQWKSLEKYVLQESSLDKLFHKTYPQNRELDDVLIKVCTLNIFYSTNIFSPTDMAQHIVSLQIDKRLERGDIDLINDIAIIHIKGEKKKFYSFATKYCSHHFDRVYPIFDRYVEKVLIYLKQIDRFSEFENKDLKNYGKFYEILSQFKAFYKLQKYNWKEIDRYLWQVGKEVFPNKY